MDSINEVLQLDNDLIPLADNKQAGTTSVDFDGLLAQPLRLHEDLKEGCGGQLWPAGIALAEYMLKNHKASLIGKKIVELGAGGGLTGLAIASSLHADAQLSPESLQDTHIHVTDQGQLLPLIQHNIALNNLPSSLVTAAVVNWGEELPSHVPSPPDVVIAADCVYFEPSFPLLLDTMHKLIGSKTICYFCQKKRRKADMRFMKLCKKQFHVTDCNDDTEVDTWRREGIFLMVENASEQEVFVGLLRQHRAPASSPSSMSFEAVRELMYPDGRPRNFDESGEPIAGQNQPLSSFRPSLRRGPLRQPQSADDLTVSRRRRQIRTQGSGPSVAPPVPMIDARWRTYRLATEASSSLSGEEGSRLKDGEHQAIRDSRRWEEGGLEESDEGEKDLDWIDKYIINPKAVHVGGDEGVAVKRQWRPGTPYKMWPWTGANWKELKRGDAERKKKYPQEVRKAEREWNRTGRKRLERQKMAESAEEHARRRAQRENRVKELMASKEDLPGANEVKEVSWRLRWEDTKTFWRSKRKDAAKRLETELESLQHEAKSLPEQHRQHHQVLARRPSLSTIDSEDDGNLPKFANHSRDMSRACSTSDVYLDLSYKSRVDPHMQTPQAIHHQPLRQTSEDLRTDFSSLNISLSPNLSLHSHPVQHSQQAGHQSQEDSGADISSHGNASRLVHRTWSYHNLRQRAHDQR
ncbi:MAG: hypothetical protein Q9159_002299 [Coniocarpon cinnabarinum]